MKVSLQKPFILTILLWGAALTAPFFYLIYSLNSSVFFDALSSPSLWQGLKTSLILCFWSGLWSVVLACVPAWGLAQMQGVKAQRWILVLMMSMAIPSSVYAAWCIESLQELGLSSRGELRLPMSGLALAMSHFTYVFIPSYLHFQKHYLQDQQMLASLGLSPWQAWKRVHFRKWLPALTMSMFLLTLESWANFEVASSFNVTTLSVMIHRQSFIHYQTDWSMWWSLMSSIPFFIFMLFLMKSLLKFPSPSSAGSLGCSVKIPSFIMPWLWFTAGFLIGWPFWSICRWSWNAVHIIYIAEWLSPILHSLSLAAMAIVLSGGWALSAVVLLPYLKKNGILKLFLNLSLVQYGLSSLSLAILISSWSLWQGEGSWMLSETPIALVWGHATKMVGLMALIALLMFSGIPQTVYAQLAALGLNAKQQWFKVLLPWKGSFVVSMVFLGLIFSLRELPLTYFLQPFDHPTLATKIHQYVQEGDVVLASPYCLVLCLISLYPVLWVSRKLIPPEV